MGETLVRDERRYEVLRERERGEGYESRRRWKGGEQEIWNKIIKKLARGGRSRAVSTRDRSLKVGIEEGCEQYLTM